MRKATVLRTVGQFQLLENTETGKFFVQNTILVERDSFANDGISYEFDAPRKETLMLVSDSEFVGRAIQCAGNNISEIITAPTTLEDFKEIEETLLGLIINPHSDEVMIRSLKVKLAVCQAKISELEKE
jgi:hypothetical protein